MNNVSNIGIIIWKKVDGVFKCHINNCNITENLVLDDYMNGLEESEQKVYHILLNKKEHRVVNKKNIKILLQ